MTFPQPPVPVLAGMELALQRADPELAAHLKALGVGALSYGWPLLRSAFAEVLPREGWLRLVDRVLANADKPDLLEAAVIGFAVASRVQLLAIESAPEAKAFFRRQQSATVLDLGRMFRVMERVSSFGPLQEWIRPGSGGGDGGGGSDGAMSALAALRSAPREFKPLPRLGAYPEYDGYPQFVIDYQAKMRERVVRGEHNKVALSEKRSTSRGNR